MTTRVEYGGLRWGISYSHSKNASWPFATWLLRPDALEVQVHVWPFVANHFIFARKEVISLRLYRGFVSRGVQIEHVRRDYPPFVVFWSFGSGRLLEEAEAAGFAI